MDVEAECPFESRAEAVTEIHQTLVSLILVWIGRELVEHGPDRPLQELPPCGHGLVEAGRHQVERSPLEQVEQALVARNPHLDGLGDAGHQVPARQGPQERRIDQYVLARIAEPYIRSTVGVVTSSALRSPIASTSALVCDCSSALEKTTW